MANAWSLIVAACLAVSWTVLGPSDRGRDRAVLCPGRALELAFPVQRGPDDRVQVVQTRLPAQRLAHLVRLGDEHWRVARATRFFFHHKRFCAHSLHALDDFADAVPVAVTAVQRHGGTAVTQVGEGVQMGGREVFHVDVVAYAGAVRVA